MTNDKEKLNQIGTRINELLITINKVTEELRSISATIKLLTIEQNQPPQQPTTFKPTITTTPTTTATTPTINSQTETKLRTLDDIRMSFPEDLEAKLSFEDKDSYITIKLKQFLGSDNFAKIASTVRGMSGEYISAGKDSHFRVPKKKNLN
jgi:hypothetical protein